MLNYLWFHMLGNRKASIQRPPTPTLRELVDIKLVGSGEKERLKEVLSEKLVECGWRDEMKALCSEFARKKGRDNVTVDELVNIITLKGRASVPDLVKAEMLQQIRSFLASTST